MCDSTNFLISLSQYLTPIHFQLYMNWAQVSDFVHMSRFIFASWVVHWEFCVHYQLACSFHVLPTMLLYISTVSPTLCNKRSILQVNTCFSYITLRNWCLDIPKHWSKFNDCCISFVRWDHGEIWSCFWTTDVNLVVLSHFALLTSVYWNDDLTINSMNVRNVDRNFGWNFGNMILIVCEKSATSQIHSSLRS